MGLAAHRHARASLFTISFIESSVFPIPPDVLMIPMILAAPHRAWLIALVATLVGSGVVDAELDALIEHLGRVHGIDHATWQLSTHD